jgi:hypothetical protein
MRRFLFMLLLVMLSFSTAVSTFGCRSAGHATGEAVEEVEEGAQEFEEGYEEGVE